MESLSGWKFNLASLGPVDLKSLFLKPRYYLLWYIPGYIECRTSSWKSHFTLVILWDLIVPYNVLYSCALLCIPSPAARV